MVCRMKLGRRKESGVLTYDNKWSERCPCDIVYDMSVAPMAPAKRTSSARVGVGNSGLRGKSCAGEAGISRVDQRSCFASGLGEEASLPQEGKAAP